MHLGDRTSGTEMMSNAGFAKYLLLWLFLLLPVAAISSTTTYIYTDPQGTPLAEADSSGNISAVFEYTPFGALVKGTAPSGPGFTGHVNDVDSALVYMQARYYDPSMGRFLAIDPLPPSIADPYNFNRYGYAKNNPVANIDPDGREAACVSSKGHCGDFAKAPPAAVQKALVATAEFLDTINNDYVIPAQGANPVIFEEASGAMEGASALLKAYAGITEIKTTTNLAEDAEAARNALSDSLAPMKGKAPATVTGGYNAKTGEVAAKACGGGKCAEDHVAAALGGNKEDIHFTTAVRPRTGEEVPICPTCEATYGRDSFPTNATFKSDK
jgi:RHS repeat-associated protein